MLRRRRFGTAGSIPGISVTSMALEICLSLAEGKKSSSSANGKNIYPEEVESHYLKSPYVGEIAVMGLESGPGEGRLHAVVVPNFDVLKQRKIVNAKEVIRYDIENLSAQLPSTKRIGSYEIWQDSLPRTTTRKLKRFEIEKRVRVNRAERPVQGTRRSAQKNL